MKTVGQLINDLQALDPNLPVYVSSDSEGNSFDTFKEVTLQHIDKADLGTYAETICSYDDLMSENDYLSDYAEVAVLWP